MILDFVIIHILIHLYRRLVADHDHIFRKGSLEIENKHALQVLIAKYLLDLNAFLLSNVQPPLVSRGESMGHYVAIHGLLAAIIKVACFNHHLFIVYACKGNIFVALEPIGRILIDYIPN